MAKELIVREGLIVGGSQVTDDVKLHIVGSGYRGLSIEAAHDGLGNAGGIFRLSGHTGGTFQFGSDVLPLNNLVQSLGGTSMAWLNVYTQNVKGRNNTNEGTLNLSSGTTSNPLTFGIGGNEKMRVDDTGYVGIGTTAPSYNLVVVDSESSATNYKLFVGRDEGQGLGIATSDYDTYITAVQDETDNHDHGILFDIKSGATGTKRYKWYFDTVQHMELLETGHLNLISAISSSSNISGSDMFINDWGSISGSLHDLNAATSTPNLNSVTAVGATSNQNIIISNTGPSLKLTDTDTSTNTIFGTDNVGGFVGTFTAGKSLRFIAASSEVFRATSDGRVGIGTTSPDSPLHINTGIGANTANTVILDRGNDTAYHGISFATTGSVDWSVGQNTSGNFEVFEDGVDSKTRFTIKEGGNVGIGVTSPNSKLHVEIPKTTLNATNLDNGSVVGLHLTYPSAATSGGEGVVIAMGMNGRGRSYIANLTSTSNLDASDMLLYTESGGTINERMRLTHNGRVGIGTDDPQNELEILGSNSPRIALRTSSETVGEALELGFQVGQNANASANTVGMIISTITQADPSSLKGDLQFSTNGGDSLVTRMTIKDNGNVGIGDDDPGYKLTVDGDISLPLGNDIRFGPQLGISKALNGVLDLYGGTGGGITFNTWNGSTYIEGATLENDNRLTVNGSIRGESFDAGGTNTTIRKIMYPEGASKYPGGSTSTGMIKITLPVSWTNSMLSFTVKVYEYTTDEYFEVKLGGYNYTSAGGVWYNTQAQIYCNGDKDHNHTVKYGHDGSKCVVTIGDTTSTWFYPQITVTDFTAGYGGATQDWETGWDIDIITDDSSITYSSTTHSNPQVTNWYAYGGDLIMNTNLTGHLGLGTTTPSKKLHVRDGANEVALFEGTGGSAWVDIKGSSSNTFSVGVDTSRFGIYDRTNSEYRLVIDDTDGNVGIGLTNPDAFFDIYSKSNSISNRGFRFRNSDGDAFFEILDDGSTYINNAGIADTITDSWTDKRHFTNSPYYGLGLTSTGKVVLQNYSLFPKNYFGHTFGLQSRVIDYVGTNVLAGKNDRLKVTHTDQSGTVTELTGNFKSGFFDFSDGGGYTIIPDAGTLATSSINVDLVTNGLYTVNGITYPEGSFILSFYPGRQPESIRVRVTDRDGDVSNWVDIPDSHFQSSYDNLKWTLEVNGNVMRDSVTDGVMGNYWTDLEFEFTPRDKGDGTAETIQCTEIEYHATRISAYQGGSVTTYGETAIQGNIDLATSTETDTRVGIGTHSPICKLHVEKDLGSSAGVRMFYLKNTNTTNPQDFSVLFGTSAHGKDIEFDLSSAAGGFVLNGGNNGFRVLTNNVDKLGIDSTGQLTLHEYGGGTITGTAAKYLAVESNGDVIEVDVPGGGIDGVGSANTLAIWSDADTLTHDTELTWDAANGKLGVNNNGINASLTVDSQTNSTQYTAFFEGANGDYPLFARNPSGSFIIHPLGYIRHYTATDGNEQSMLLRGSGSYYQDWRPTYKDGHPDNNKQFAIVGYPTKDSDVFEIEAVEGSIKFTSTSSIDLEPETNVFVNGASATTALVNIKEKSEDGGPVYSLGIEAHNSTTVKSGFVIDKGSVHAPTVLLNDTGDDGWLATSYPGHYELRGNGNSDLLEYSSDAGTTTYQIQTQAQVRRTGGSGVVTTHATTGEVTVTGITHPVTGVSTTPQIVQPTLLNPGGAYLVYTKSTAVGSVTFVCYNASTGALLTNTSVSIEFTWSV